MTFPIVIDRTGQVADAWRIGGPIEGIPSSYFIDADGVVRARALRPDDAGRSCGRTSRRSSDDGQPSPRPHARRFVFDVPAGLAHAHVGALRRVLHRRAGDVRPAGRARSRRCRRRCAATTRRSTRGSRRSAAPSAPSPTRCTGSACSTSSTRTLVSLRARLPRRQRHRLHVQPLVADVPQRLPSAERCRQLLRARAQPRGARAGRSGDGGIGTTLAALQREDAGGGRRDVPLRRPLSVDAARDVHQPPGADPLHRGRARDVAHRLHGETFAGEGTTVPVFAVSTPTSSRCVSMTRSGASANRATRSTSART